MSDCIFCRIATGDVPARIAYQDDTAVAFHDLAPRAPTHVLIIPREHVRDLGHATPDHRLVLGHLLDIARRVAVEQGLEDGYRVVLNVGRDGGQSVDHLHVHLLGGRALGWPPG